MHLISVHLFLMFVISHPTVDNLFSRFSPDLTLLTEPNPWDIYLFDVLIYMFFFVMIDNDIIEGPSRISLNCPIRYAPYLFKKILFPKVTEMVLVIAEFLCWLVNVFGIVFVFFYYFYAALDESRHLLKGNCANIFRFVSCCGALQIRWFVLGALGTLTGLARLR